MGCKNHEESGYNLYLDLLITLYKFKCFRILGEARMVGKSKHLRPIYFYGPYLWSLFLTPASTLE